MADAWFLANEVRRAIDGDPWFGRSATMLLADVDAATAAARVAGLDHSIWEVVAHMTTWAEYVAYRLEGGVPCDPPGGDWPAIRVADGEAWTQAIDDLETAHEQLAEAIAAAPEASLDNVGPETPLDADGEPVTLRRAAEGVVQHDAYHCGQIALLKRLLAIDA